MVLPRRSRSTRRGPDIARVHLRTGRGVFRSDTWNQVGLSNENHLHSDFIHHHFIIHHEFLIYNEFIINHEFSYLCHELIVFFHEITGRTKRQRRELPFRGITGCRCHGGNYRTFPSNQEEMTLGFCVRISDWD